MPKSFNVKKDDTMKKSSIIAAFLTIVTIIVLYFLGSGTFTIISVLATATMWFVIDLITSSKDDD